MSESSFLKLKDLIAKQLVPHNKGTYLQNYLYMIYGPFVNYTESIIILCNSGKVNAAGVLLRSLVEAHININYMQTKKSIEHLAESALESAHQKITICNSFRSLLKRHPHLQSQKEDSLYNLEKLEAMEKWANDELKKLINSNDFDPKYKNPKFTKPLLQKALECDMENFEAAPKGYFEDKYVLEYRFLSPLAHLNIEGLGHFVEEVDSTIKHKDSNQVEMIQDTATDLYEALIKDLYEHKVINVEMSDEIKNLLTWSVLDTTKSQFEK